ncbi:MAG: efflux RND transporter permease subunit [Planctomycetes bacterium]|nr:efflux RND transporter permease subunit [Planctomycetota bacterium]
MSSSRPAGLVGLAMDRPVTVAMLFVAGVVVGVLAYLRMPVQLMPSGFTSPHLWVYVPYPQANPQEVENSIARPLEEMLGTVRHVTELGTNSSSNGCQVSLSFHANADMDLAYAEVTDRINRVRGRFPADANQVYVWKNDVNDAPVVWMGVAPGTPGDGGGAGAGGGAGGGSGLAADPYVLIEKGLKPRLERLPGVAKVELDGLVDRIVSIDLDPARVKSRHLDAYSLVQALRSSNFSLASGVVEDGGRRYLVRSLARLDSLDAIRDLPVAPGVLLRDVAEVGLASSIRERITRIDRRPAVTLAIYRESTANTVDVCRAVRRVVENELPAEPEFAGLRSAILFDQGKWIGEAIDNLIESAWLGGLLAVAVLYLFLFRVRMTLLIALSIPVSFLLTLAVLYFSGGSLNLITLMGLTLAVGMLVDNSIVVVENVYRLRLQGRNMREASGVGAGEVALAVILSTATSVVVFLPLILMNESAEFRFYMGQLSAPVSWSLGASLIVALIFVPVAAARLAGGKPPRELAAIAWCRRAYGRCLACALGHRLEALVLSLLLLGSSAWPYQHVKRVDEVEGHPGTIHLSFRFPEHYDLDDANQTVSLLENVLLSHREELGIENLFASFRETRAHLGLFLKSQSKSGRRVDEVLEKVKALLPTLPGVDLRINWKNSESGDGSVTLRLRGESTETLVGLAEEVRRRVRDLPGVLGVETELEEGGPEIHVTVDRALAAKHGVDSWAVGGTVLYALRGSGLPDFRLGDREIPMRVRFSTEVRESLALLRNVAVANREGREVPLEGVASFAFARGLGTISRQDRRTCFNVKILTRKDDLASLSAALDERMKGFELPRGYEWDKGTRLSKMAENSGTFMFAILLAMVFVFLLMGFLFESFVLPLAVMASIPYAFFGVYWTLWLTGTPIDMMASIGVIILVGVVVNNAIVLVDLVNRLRGEGLGRREAILEAGRDRFRPIWMTALTTLVGLIPMAVGNSNLMGIPYYPMGRAIMGGLLASTVVSLVVVPLFYDYLDDLRVFAGRMAGQVLEDRRP